MASPPFQVEDQTDEDFFDKLVDDEFTGPGFGEGDDSNEVRAFSNLSIGKLGTLSEDSGCKGGIAARGNILVAEESISLVSSNSFGFDEVIESSDAAMGVDVALESTTSKNSGSTGTDVKEVQWSSFNIDSSQHHGFGSYSDLLTNLGDSSLDPIGNAGDNSKVESNNVYGIAENKVSDMTSFNYVQHQEDQAYGAATEQTTDGQDLYSSEYWENLYPGWRYDPNTGEWHQLDGGDATANIQGSFVANSLSAGVDVVSDQISEISYLQQTPESVVGTIAEGCTTGNVSNWNQVSQGSTEYPANMKFDPQYPGWYYDMIAQEWRSLDSYTQAVESTSTGHEQHNQNENASTSGFFPDKDHNLYGEYGQVETFGSQGLGNQHQGGKWTGSASNYNQQDMNRWQPETVVRSDVITGFTGNQQPKNLYGSRGSVNYYADKQMGFDLIGTVTLSEQTRHNHDGSNEAFGFQSFAPSENLCQPLNQPNMEQSQEMHFSQDYYGSQKSEIFSQQPFQSGTQFSYAPNGGRSSSGRPPHALVNFGFGGKLIVMKDSSSLVTNSAYGSQDSVGSSISILNLMQVFMDKTDTASTGIGACDYFCTLCNHSFPGPLVGGNVGSKELNKWIDERISNCESPNMDYRRGGSLRLLLSLLKIAFQHYGKLRSPFGIDPILKESDCPESAVAKLFAYAKRNGVQLSEYGAPINCLQHLPSEEQIRATAVEVQNLLVSGRNKMAQQCAQEGQLWGPALVLAAQLGDQIRANAMLDDWEENLGIITANRTKDDELVIIHLGDCLWKERDEVAAAHTCYLVAEANIESYSDSARLCLIGADHWKSPRTYASPEAIQTEDRIIEYSKGAWKSQLSYLPPVFQPYKTYIAHMLAKWEKSFQIRLPDEKSAMVEEASNHKLKSAARHPANNFSLQKERWIYHINTALKSESCASMRGMKAEASYAGFDFPDESYIKSALFKVKVMSMELGSIQGTLKRGFECVRKSIALHEEFASADVEVMELLNVKEGVLVLL
ncbi:hypothetical protein HHK36_032370 [Tetracentron sinense]|uniref:Protein transport protein sec16 n=1 Tax=Tetracentron sinense TaxID=13715 RepID=A0A834Y7F1_TETSI|nr:hypothetical protein HHK36_032370 [Tetracentron sinense]